MQATPNDKAWALVQQLPMEPCRVATTLFVVVV